MNFISSDNIEKIISMLKDEVTKYIAKKNTLGKKTNEETNLDIDNNIKNYLNKKYPYYVFFSGKSGNYNIDPTMPTWVISPIASTLDSTHKLEHKAISLALVYENDSLFGAVYIPSTDELFYAVKEKGAFLNGKKITASNTSSIDITDNMYDSRPTSSAAIHICHVATGKADMYLRDKIRPWDYAAATCIIEEAGGKITTTTNGILTYYTKANILATNGLIHESLLPLIN